MSKKYDHVFAGKVLIEEINLLEEEIKRMVGHNWTNSYDEMAANLDKRLTLEEREKYLAALRDAKILFTIMSGISYLTK